MLSSLALAAALTVRILPANAAASIVREAGANRAVVVHYWALWCPACVEEWPKLAPELKRFAAAGARVATVSLDPKARAAKDIPAALQRFGADRFPAFLLDAPEPDPVVEAIDKTWDGSLPATFVYDAEGKRLASFFGAADRGALRGAVAQAMRRGRLTPPSAPH